MTSDLLVVGAGASGLACAVAGARLGLSVVVLEKMDRCGHKLSLTGGKKCNFTHVASSEEVAAKFENGRRLLPLLRRFPYERITAFFDTLSIASRTDLDGCVWPKGLDAAGVRDRLVREVTRLGGQVRTSCRVVEIRPSWVVATLQERIPCRNVCVATGGASFPQTGATGDGLALCRKIGLATADWFATLASLRTEEDLYALAGITHRPVAAVLVVDGKPVKHARGHFIFAHRYVSGSAVLVLCGAAARNLAAGRRVSLRVDWLPDRSEGDLAAFFAQGRREHPRRQVLTVLAAQMARRLGTLLCAKADVPSGRMMAELTRAEERRIIAVVKGTELVITGTEPMERATVTGGGVSLDEIDIATCRAKRFPGLFITGELLDTWAETGGYNLHFAWATGIAVAEAIAGKELKWGQKVEV